MPDTAPVADLEHALSNALLVVMAHDPTWPESFRQAEDKRPYLTAVAAHLPGTDLTEGVVSAVLGSLDDD